MGWFQQRLQQTINFFTGRRAGSVPAQKPESQKVKGGYTPRTEVSKVGRAFFDDRPFIPGDVVSVTGMRGAGFVVDYKKWFQRKDWDQFEDRSHVAVRRDDRIHTIPTSEVHLLRRRKPFSGKKKQ